MLLLPGESGIRVEVRGGAELGRVPQLSLSDLTVTVAPYSSPEERETHFLNTVGSGYWHPSAEDEVRFDPDSGQALSFVLHIPEATAPPADAPIGSDAPAVLLLPRPRPRHFAIPPSKVRHVPPDGSFLTCLWETESPDDAIRIAENFTLLATGGRVCGWRLSDPERFLATDPPRHPPEPPDSELGRALGTYFRTVDAAAADKLDDEDPDLRRELESLRDSLDLDSGASTRRRSLVAAIDELITFFF